MGKKKGQNKMKKRLISHCAAGIFSLIAFHASGQECNITVSEDNAGDDIIRILKCLNERIKSLESISSGGNVRQGAGATPTKAEFDAGTFAVSVRSAIRSEDDTPYGRLQRIHILLNLRNKTTADVYIGTGGAQSYNQILFDEASGQSDQTDTMNGLNRLYYANKREDFSTIPANSTVSTSLIFDGRKISGNSANLNLTLWEFASPDFRKVAVPLNVRIGTKKSAKP